MTIDTTRLRELALAATQGQWYTGTGADADYISAANPETMLILLDELDAANTSRRAAQARVAELTEQVQKMRVHLHRNTAAAMNAPHACGWMSVADMEGGAA